VTSPRTGFSYLDEVLRRPGTVLAFAHRGGAYHPEIEGLENTMAAFRHAVALGYTYLETDVHVTRDGVLLAFHDRVLDRVSDRRGPVAALTLDEVRSARIGGREYVPTLAELFDEFPETRFNIDLKAEGSVAALAAFVADREAWDRVLVGSFSARRLRLFRPTRPRSSPSGCCRAAGSPTGSPAVRSPRSRSPTGEAGWWSPPAVSYDARTRPASTCTCGPSTMPAR
jgi:glycerophosphoryl diester phosphodiesterase